MENQQETVPVPKVVPTILKYIDLDARRAIANLPPRDVTQSEIDACGYSIEQILGTGIYQQVEGGTQPSAPDQPSQEQPQDSTPQEGQS